MIAIVIFLVFVVVFIGALKLLGTYAMNTVSIVVNGLSMEQIVDIGTKRSESALRRLRGRAKVYQATDGSGSVYWNAKCGGGSVTFMVTPLVDGSFDVSAAATSMKLVKKYGGFDLTSDYGRTHFWLYALLWKFGIPHNPRALLFCRWRGLHAIKRAGTPVPSTPVSA